MVEIFRTTNNQTVARMRHNILNKVYAFGYQSAAFVEYEIKLKTRNIYEERCGNFLER